MAGIGIKLNKVFSKNTLVTDLYGIACSIGYTILPMLVVIGCLVGMEYFLGFDKVGGTERELFSTSILYIFIFSLITTAPYNSVLSKYMTDRIYMEAYDDIRPSIYFGVSAILCTAAVLGIPFYIHELIVGKVPLYYVATSFWGYLSLTLVFTVMIYNSILKAYKKISLYFFGGMTLSFVLSLIFHFLLHWSVTYSMLLALTIGLFLIALLEMNNASKYFKTNSGRYKPIAKYFKRYWKLVIANLFYSLGLFSHNFVFWTHPWKMIVVKSYVCNQPYDMATCIAMFTNISATTFFIARLEMQFHESYAGYMNSIIGGKLDTIEKFKGKMFRSLSNQLSSLVRLQFSVSVVIFMIAMIFLPMFGASGLTMQIYPLLAVGYFMVFVYYSSLLYLYYFNDLTGAMISSLLFFGIALVGSILSKHLPVIWYGSGFTFGSFVAFTYCYFRIQWLEKNIEKFIMCRGSIMHRGAGEKPSSLVYDKNNKENI